MWWVISGDGVLGDLGKSFGRRSDRGFPIWEVVFSVLPETLNLPSPHFAGAEPRPEPRDRGVPGVRQHASNVGASGTPRQILTNLASYWFQS